MSRRSDTVSIISDDTEGAVGVTVYSATIDYTLRPHVVSASAVVSSATVMFFPYRASMNRTDSGVIVGATDLIVFPWTSTVFVQHRIKKNADPGDFYEVLQVDVFEDHKEVYAKKVDNR